MFNWFAASLNLTMQSSGFVKFNGFNYAEWAEHIQFQLGVMNLDLALAMEQKPAALTDESTDAEKSTYEAWIDLTD